VGLDVDALVVEYQILFLKWDQNRDLIDADVHDQTLAVYRLLDELRTRHPGLEIESCSSGGARIDLGVLERTDRVWASDCIDALERQAIQR
jgi:alpha-galactosidase